jgi:hypothetical protein
MNSMLTAAFLFLALGIGVEQTSEAEALRVLDDFMAAFNNRDIDARAGLLHYPHVRIASGGVSIWNAAEEFKAARTPADRERFVRATEWHHSAWDSREVVHSSDDKVHIAVRFTRYRENGSVIGTYDSLYIVTKREGRWGIQARSSYAPRVP